jgi:hypothetical protein
MMHRFIVSLAFVVLLAAVIGASIGVFAILFGRKPK